MGPKKQLRVRVNDELILDAGTVEAVRKDDGTALLIRAPRTTLFHQVLDYIRTKPDPPKPPSGSMVGREGLAAAALALRWGSYLAVLVDHDKPIWDEVNSPSTSRVSNGEMARINIEASAAIAEWVDIYRADNGGEYFRRLVNRAVAYLPMPRKRSKRASTEFGFLAIPSVAEEVVRTASKVSLQKARADVARNPSRVFANALVTHAWRRSGPIEEMHGGEFRGYPLDKRRITPEEERALMTSAAERLAQGTDTCLGFSLEQPRRQWAEQVLPYALAQLLSVGDERCIRVAHSSRWSLTEVSRDVRLSTLRSRASSSRSARSAR